MEIPTDTDIIIIIVLTSVIIIISTSDIIIVLTSVIIVVLAVVVPDVPLNTCDGHSVATLFCLSTFIWATVFFVLDL